jgi:MFS family permease
MILYTLVGKLSGVYGRKPLLIIFFIGSTITIVLLPLSWAANHRWLERAILVVWMTFGSVANMRAVLLLMSMYIVDTTDVKSR